MRKILFVMLALVLPMVASAQERTPRLVVWQKSGEKVYFKLADLPETTFEDNLLIIKTRNATAEYQLSNILRYTYEGVPDGVELLPNERSVVINDKGDAVTFQGLRDGTVASLYTAGGVLLEQRTAADGQTISFSIKNRPRGVYIAKAGTETIKLMRP